MLSFDNSIPHCAADEFSTLNQSTKMESAEWCNSYTSVGISYTR